MKISVILLAHEKPDHLRTLIETLLSAGSDIFVHYDASSRYSLKEEVTKWDLGKYNGKLYHADRIEVKWGEWSIVEATLKCLRIAQKNHYNADYFMLLSGSCMPIKPLYLLKNYLKGVNNKDIIESVNAIDIRWVSGGIQNERWENYHFFNWRFQKKLFDISLFIQTKLKVKRKLPFNHIPHLGSQWWCLRKESIEIILNFFKENHSKMRFYKYTLVPDELFFQTMVSNLIPKNEIEQAILTKYSFNSWGIPRVYYNNNYDELLAEDETKFFARKINHDSHDLKVLLSSLFLMKHKHYTELMNRPNKKLLNELKLKKRVEAAEWYSLCTYNTDIVEYIKSIPNNMIGIIGKNRKHNETMLSYISDLLPNSCSIKDLFKSEDSLHSDWHLELGDIAFSNKNKHILFTMEHNLKVINKLKCKKNFLLIFLDDKSNLDENSTLLEIMKMKKDDKMYDELIRELDKLDELDDRLCDYIEVDSISEKIIVSKLIQKI